MSQLAPGEQDRLQRIRDAAFREVTDAIFASGWRSLESLGIGPATTDRLRADATNPLIQEAADGAIQLLGSTQSPFNPPGDVTNKSSNIRDAISSACCHFQRPERITAEPSPPPYVDLRRPNILRRVLVKEVLREAFEDLGLFTGSSDSVHGEFAEVLSWEQVPPGASGGPTVREIEEAQENGVTQVQTKTLFEVPRRPF